MAITHRVVTPVANNLNKNTVSNPKDLLTASKSTETQGKVKLQFTKEAQKVFKQILKTAKSSTVFGILLPSHQKKKINESLPDKSKPTQASLTVTHTRIGEANAEGKKRIDNQEDISGYLSHVQTAVTTRQIRLTFVSEGTGL